MSGHRQHLVITNDLTALCEVRQMISRAIDAGGFPQHYLNRLQIAVDEAVTNIIEHGYADLAPGSATIELSVEARPDVVRIVVVDSGTQFDPESYRDVDIESQVRSGRAGGLGVFLMRKIMDLIEYHAETGKKNRLVMVKYNRNSQRIPAIG